MGQAFQPFSGYSGMCVYNQRGQLVGLVESVSNDGVCLSVRKIPSHDVIKRCLLEKRNKDFSEMEIKCSTLLMKGFKAGIPGPMIFQMLPIFSPNDDHSNEKEKENIFAIKGLERRTMRTMLSFYQKELKSEVFEIFLRSKKEGNPLGISRLGNYYYVCYQMNNIEHYRIRKYRKNYKEEELESKIIEIKECRINSFNILEDGTFLFGGSYSDGDSVVFVLNKETFEITTEYALKSKIKSHGILTKGCEFFVDCEKEGVKFARMDEGKFEKKNCTIFKKAEEIRGLFKGHRILRVIVRKLRSSLLADCLVITKKNEQDEFDMTHDFVVPCVYFLPHIVQRPYEKMDEKERFKDAFDLNGKYDGSIMVTNSFIQIKLPDFLRRSH